MNLLLQVLRPIAVVSSCRIVRSACAVIFLGLLCPAASGPARAFAFGCFAFIDVVPSRCLNPRSVFLVPPFQMVAR